MSAGQRIVVVTGGSQNIGLAIGERYLENGDIVISADLNPPQNDDIKFHKTDIASQESVRALMAYLDVEFGHLDVLVNNAGICIEAPIAQMSEDEWDKVMAVNVKGVFLTTKHVFPLMADGKSKNPAIVNISSIEGIGANPLHGAYGASKGAVAAFTHNTALEFGPHGIRCNAVAPGWINTPFNENLLANYPDRKKVDAEIKALHPVGRLGLGADIANTVFWLSGNEAAFLTGQEIVVDGGRLAKLPLPKL